MKVDKQNKQAVSNRLKFYFAWPMILSTVLIAMNAAIYMINADIAILISLFLMVYVVFAVFIYIFGKIGFKTEMVRYAMDIAKIEAARLNEMEVPYAVVDERGNIHWCNDAFYDIANSDNVDKKSILELFPEFSNELSSVEESDIEIIAKKDGKEYRVVFRRKTEAEEAEKQ